jgi:uncharacterized membrane protein (DUF4010 family)
MDNAVLPSLFVAACLGALVGLERQWGEQHEPDPIPDADAVTGLRTHTLWSVLGFLAAWVQSLGSPHFFPVAYAVFAAHLVGLRFLTGRTTNPGYTSFAVALVVFLLGALVFWGQARLAAAAAISMVVLLALKPQVHGLARAVTPEDMRSALQLAAVSGVILPLVPNRNLGPYHAFNPYDTWLMVVLITGIGFTGYVATRVAGARLGTALTGLIGGLASSTAVTLALARRSRETAPLTCLLGMTLASLVMLGRVAVLAAVVSPHFFQCVAPLLALIALPGLGYAIHSWLRAPREPAVDRLAVRNPAGLGVAVKFGIAYALVVLMVKVVLGKFGGAGLLLVSFLSGLTDLDAITLTLARMSRDSGLDLSLAARGLLLALAANTLFKTGLTLAAGASVLRRPATVLGVATAALCAAAAVWMR